MAWDKDLPAGSAKINIGDNAIRANNAWLEDSLNESMIYPGDSNTQGRLRFLNNYTSVQELALSNPEDGQVSRRSDIGSPALSMYVTDHYEMITSRAPAVDAAAQAALALILTTNDEGFTILRKYSATVYAPLVWSGTAFVRPAPQLLVEGHQDIAGGPSTETDMGARGTLWQDPTDGPWDLVNDGTDDYEVSLTVPDVGGANVRVTARTCLAAVRTNGTTGDYILALMEELDGAAETVMDHRGLGLQNDSNSDYVEANSAWNWESANVLAGPSGAAETWVYRVRTRLRGTGASVGGAQWVVAPVDNTDGLGSNRERHPFRPNCFMNVKVELA